MTVSAREEILRSIRTQLAVSARDHLEENHHVQPLQPEVETAAEKPDRETLIRLFAENLQAVDGQVVVVDRETETFEAIRAILSKLKSTRLKPRRVAISDSKEVAEIEQFIAGEVEEVATTPCASELFGFDVGISTVQAGIAETGTLVLEANREKNRLVSLVPPVHIAILDATRIFCTLGETLAALYRGGNLSQAITFITGPSRTADIELTLAIGVHGPQELYVIIRR